MSFLKSIKLKKEGESIRDPEVKREEIKFLYKKHRKSNRAKPLDVLTISKNGVTLRREIYERLAIKDRKGSAALILYKGRVALIVDPEKLDPELYAILYPNVDDWGAVYVNVPKNSRQFVDKFRGDYKVGDIHTYEHYKVAELLSLAE